MGVPEFLLAMIAFFVILGVFASQDEERRRSQLDAEASAKAAKTAAIQAARLEALQRVGRTVSGAQSAAGRLAIVLGSAELMLGRAQDELNAGLYSPFWEAIEGATAHLGEFDNTLTSIKHLRGLYPGQAADLGTEAPPFSLGVSVLPDPSETRQRLVALYRKAQANPHFAIVYEQRRTNAILVSGFRSLGQAIEGLGERITDSITSLGTSLDLRLGSIESSLESAAAAAAEQSAALRAELVRSTSIGGATLGQMRQDAEARAESERDALRMLNNIQRRRKPSAFDRQ